VTNFSDIFMRIYCAGMVMYTVLMVIVFENFWYAEKVSWIIFLKDLRQWTNRNLSIFTFAAVEPIPPMKTNTAGSNIVGPREHSQYKFTSTIEIFGVHDLGILRLPFLFTERAHYLYCEVIHNFHFSNSTSLMLILYASVLRVVWNYGCRCQY
jgi:hypothetical protein